jgi:hypothetical protein
VPQLRLAEQEQHRRDDAAGPPGGLVDDADLRAVRHHHDDPVARPQPGLAQAGGQPPRPRAQVGEGPRAALEDEDGLLPDALPGGLGEPLQAAAGRGGEHAALACSHGHEHPFRPEKERVGASSAPGGGSAIA